MAELKEKVSAQGVNSASPEEQPPVQPNSGEALVVAQTNLRAQSELLAIRTTRNHGKRARPIKERSSFAM